MTNPKKLNKESAVRSALANGLNLHKDYFTLNTESKRKLIELYDHCVYRASANHASGRSIYYQFWLYLQKEYDHNLAYYS